MRKICVIAVREYQAAVSTKAFVIGLVLMPVLMGGSIVVQVLLKEPGDTRRQDVRRRRPHAGRAARRGLWKRRARRATQASSTTPRPASRPSRSSSSSASSRRADDPAAIGEQRLELSRARAQGRDLIGFLEIGAERARRPAASTMPGQPSADATIAVLRYQTKQPTYGDVPPLGRARAVNEAVAGASPSSPKQEDRCSRRDVGSRRAARRSRGCRSATRDRRGRGRRRREPRSPRSWCRSC